MAYSTIDGVGRFRALLEASEALADLKVEFVRVPSEIHEKSVKAKSPVIHVYCDQIENRRTEKFRPFSGRMRLVTEVRVSQDRLEGITEALHVYLDALRDVMEQSAGCAGDGMYLDGEYEVTIEAVRKGGLNYQQVAKITCWAILNRS
ncbi:MAG: hypothetical protein IPP47_27000 [Bryobacterales bacterium]|nr:hypothetical protein [Bryobacterales bacterium]